VHALQIHPRAPWALVGEVLAIDPVTAARRWQRMERDRLAWVTAYPRLADARNAVTAVVEIDTRAGAAPQVAETVAAHPRALNVKETAGGRDLVVSAQAPTLDELARFVSLRLATVPGVTATRTRPCAARRPGRPPAAVAGGRTGGPRGCARRAGCAATRR
jgi:DNA-binding Lrp family transcriptional regulator